jgi:hypothetical protein
MKTVVGATAGLRRDQLSAGTFALGGKPATALVSSGTTWVYTPAHQGEQILANVKEKVEVEDLAGVRQFRFHPPGMFYPSWMVLTRAKLEPSESTEKTSGTFTAGGAATVNEGLIGPGAPLPRWTDLALSAFPKMRGMTAAESASYKALKQKVFQRR